ncbi:MAG: hypothetical protein KAV00_15510 [Phycisphaerae bacterium]|nr:hypothetical protein [Phycisphaerae bacterium]
MSKVWEDNLGVLLAQVTDHRLYEEQDVKAGLLFVFHPEDLLSKFGCEYKGHNVASLGWCYRLIIKVVMDGIPLVAFINEGTPTRCMRVFVRKLEEGRVTWQKDKYARS